MHSVKLANLIIITASTNYFEWDGKTKTFSAEVSDMYGSPLVISNGQLRLQRINPDNLDLGIALQSAETGVTKMFKLIETHRVEGDTMFWRFQIVDQSNGPVSVVIFND